MFLYGEWVQKRRNQLGLARQVGCSSVTIKKIERNERRPSVQLTQLLAQHLQSPESEQDNFVRRARGEYVPELVSPEKIIVEGQESVASLGEAEERYVVAELPPKLVVEAEARGRELDLWQTAEALLAEEA